LSMVRIGFTGSRNVDGRVNAVRTLVRSILATCNRCIVGHGGARGVDAIVHEEARRAGLDVVVFAPRRMGRESLLARDIELAKWSDKLVAIFVNSVTPGTAFTLTAGVLLGKHVDAYIVDGAGARKLARDEVDNVVARFRPGVEKRLKQVNLGTWLW